MTVNIESQPAVASLERRASFGKLHIISFIAIAVIAFLAFDHLMAEVDLASVRQALSEFNTSSLVIAAIATALSYISMMGYDLCGIKYAKVKVPPLHAFRTSFCAFGLGNTLGGGWLSSGTIRFRLYSAAGVDPLSIGKIIAFITWGFGLGIVAISVIGLIARPEVIADLFNLANWVPYSLGLAGAGLVLIILVIPWFVRHMKFFRWTLPLPSGPLTFAQVALAILDVAFAALTLWFLLPAHDVPLATYLGIYAIAIAAGLISHVPGGLGVFETVIIFALKDHIDIPELTAALVVYRIVYYLAPFVLALTLFVQHEATVIRRWYKGSFLSQGAGNYGHLVIAGATFFTGAMLIASGALPTGRASLEMLEQHIPLLVQEGSHILASLSGFMLLVLSQSLRLRSLRAWQLSCLIIALNVPFAFFKAMATFEIIALGVLLLLLGMSRAAFYRRTRLSDLNLTMDWWVAVGGTLLAVFWLLMFAYKHMDFESELWWHFNSMTEASRSIRAFGAVAALTAILAISHYLRVGRGHPKQPDARMREKVAHVVANQDRSEACLANLGDKYFLMSESGRSFIMYGIRGRTWIALQDPVGPADEHDELIWRFREMCDRAGARAVAYQVSAAALPAYLDAGFTARRLGEEARVPLETFDPNSGELSFLAQSFAKAQGLGLSFEVVPKEEVRHHLETIREVSEVWLNSHQIREKGFSIGNFTDSYVLSQPIALVRQEGQVIGFASLMLTNQTHEVGVDLLRHTPDAPKAWMDFLLVSLMLHYKEQGYRCFCLGLAPLVGVPLQPIASFWQKVGRQLYLYGQRRFRPKRVRAYKQKFKPAWQPRYLLSTSSLGASSSMLDVAALISGDFRDMARK